MLVGATALALGGTGCDQLSARRHIQKGTSLYEDDKYEEAAAEFEAGLQVDNDLAIGHYNAGLTYYKLFRPGDPSPENKKYADKCVEHFQAWLKSNPEDKDTAEIISEVWVNNEEYEKALAYWQGEHDAHPKEVWPVKQLASINYKAGRFDDTVKWYLVQAQVEPKKDDQVVAYLLVGRFAWNKLGEADFKTGQPKVSGEERVRIADVGIAALQKAAALDDKNIEAEGMQGALYNFRSLAHGAYWAESVDRAIGVHHSKRASVLKEEAKKAQGQAPPPAPAGSGQAGG